MAARERDTHGLELWYLPYSPWSEKARWALDACALEYTAHTYQPLIGEPALRWLLKRPRGLVSVPVLRAPAGVFTDSWDIARYAYQHKATAGQGVELFPVHHERRLQHYNGLSEQGLRAGRARALGRLLLHRRGLAELVPRGLRTRLGPLAPTLGAVGIRRTLSKYGGDRVSEEAHERALTEVLDALRAGLRGGSGRHHASTLLGEFSYADIAMAQVLAFVDPPSVGLRLSQGAREAFRDPVLGPRYRDLLAWRDQLYARYRSLGKPAVAAAHAG